MTYNTSHIEAIIGRGRDAVIKAIRVSLQERSGKAWSVTGGRGTAWGWITIYAPPSRCTGHAVVKAGASGVNPEDYEYKDTGEPNGNMTSADSAELAKLMGLPAVHHQGENVPASNAYQRVALWRAMTGTDGGHKVEPYWD